jgi:hypothetical protein
MPAAPERVSSRSRSAIPAVRATCDPRFTYRSWFTGAVLPVAGIDTLVVVVQPQIMFDPHEAALYLAAFQIRFGRAVVLMSQDASTCAPTYRGPDAIIEVLRSLPFEMLPWQRMLYRVAKPRPFQLPIPPDRPSDQSGAVHATPRTGSYSSSIEELARTRVRRPAVAKLASDPSTIALATRDLKVPVSGKAVPPRSLPPPSPPARRQTPAPPEPPASAIRK